MRTAALAITVLVGYAAVAGSQPKIDSWLDAPKPASWNKASSAIPTAPKIDGAVDPRCRKQARPPQLEEDTRVSERGWDLVGAFHGGWQVLVIRGAAGYDGMCRPRQYQDFVFVRGVFAGTLSPQPSDSRTDGAPTQVFLQSGTRLTVEYERYAATDAACCPSSTTTVTFDVAGDAPVVRPVSAFTAKR
ncbi:MAG TPA: LppP/LprE family lipoprotein [Vicinamibacterales bacterium]